MIGNIKIKFTTSLALVLSFPASSSFACSCINGGEFANNSQYSDEIIRAKVIAINYGKKSLGTFSKSMTVEVTDIIRGNFPHSELELIGDEYGVICGSRINSQKREFLFDIHNLEEKQVFSECGESSVLIENNIVKSRRLSSSGYQPYSMPFNTMMGRMDAKKTEYQKFVTELEDSKHKDDKSVIAEILDKLRSFLGF